METKQCSKCGEVKPLDYANYMRNAKNGSQRSYCNTCGNLMCQSYKARNREKISAYNKVYKAFYKEEHIEYNRQYNIENKEEIYRKRQEHIKNDPNFKMRLSIASRIKKEIKTIHDLKGQKSYIDLLGCSGEFFKYWIGYLDENGDYLWEEHGNWHLDHVKPCCSFDLTNESELAECFHWSNYQPLEKGKNFSKGGKLDLVLINTHKQKVNKFIKEYAQKYFNENDYTIL